MRPTRLAYAARAVALCATFGCAGRSGAASSAATIEVPPGRDAVSAIAWRQVDGSVGRIFGRVLADTLEATQAIVRIRQSGESGSGRSVQVAADGTFELAAVPPGLYEVRVLRLGYAVARATVRVPADGGVKLTAVLVVAPSLLQTDIF